MPKKYIVGRRVGGSIKRLSSHRKKSSACKRLQTHGSDYDRDPKVDVFKVTGDGLHARRVISSCDSWRGKRRRLR